MTLSASDADRTGTVRKNRLFGIGVVVAWLLVWQGFAQLELLNPALFPSPGAILLRLYRSLLVTGELGTHLRDRHPAPRRVCARSTAGAVARLEDGAK